MISEAMAAILLRTAADDGSSQSCWPPVVESSSQPAFLKVSRRSAVAPVMLKQKSHAWTRIPYGRAAAMHAASWSPWRVKAAERGAAEMAQFAETGDAVLTKISVIPAAASSLHVRGQSPG